MLAPGRCSSVKATFLGPQPVRQARLEPDAASWLHSLCTKAQPKQCYQMLLLQGACQALKPHRKLKSIQDQTWYQKMPLLLLLCFKATSFASVRVCSDVFWPKVNLNCKTWIQI